MEIRTVNEFQQSTAASRSDKNSAQLTQEDFMKLMLQQLKHQDPFKPMDQAQFLGQMAQFSTVSGISEMKNSMASLADSLRSTQLLNASTLIGKKALVASDTAILSQGGSVSGQLELPVSTQGAQIQILKPSGEMVNTIALGPQSSGPVNFTWNGRNLGGEPMPAGEYVIRANYFNGERLEAVQPYIKAGIESVSVPPGGGSARLHVDGIGTVSLSEVKELS